MAQRLRILVIGASGLLGRAIAAELAPRHEIVAAGSKSGARGFPRSVEGVETGKTYRVY